jgi:hypothetical protein
MVRARLLPSSSLQVALIVAVTWAGLVEEQASAQTIATISMAPAPASPQIVGATTLSSKPGSPLLFTIGATGSPAPTFSATGLPAGISLSQSGTLSGTTPAAGTYTIDVTVTNSAGSAKATLTLVAGNTLAVTPPMGWNSYDSFGSSVTENEVMQAAQAQQATLLAAGYRYVVVDYLWFDPEDVVDANGRFLPSPSRFPSATGSSGFTSLANRVHALGLSFGIHIMRGIPRSSVSKNSSIAGSTYKASQAANTSDACPWDAHMWGVSGATPAGQAWYDSIFAQYAAWGVDFVKVDDMINNTVSPMVYHRPEADAIRGAIDQTGRSMVFSLSPGPMQTSDALSLEADANQWRMVNDFWDVNGLSTLSDVFNAAASWQAVTSLSPGHWPDADMLPLGYLGPRCPVHQSGLTALSHNQQVAVMTLWGILPSPLIFGGNEPMLSGDAWTTALLTNPEVVAVNQDALGKEATVFSQSGTQQTWTRDLSGGRKAVAFFNRGTQDATMSITLASIGMPSNSTVRDAWHRSEVSVTNGVPSISVPYQAAVLLVITPPQLATSDAGAPDAGGDAAASEGGPGGSGSSTGSGSSGSSGSVGASSGLGSSSGSTSSGGGGSSTGSNSSGASGGISSSGAQGGPTAVGADSGTTTVPNETSSGCSCRIGRDEGDHNATLLAIVALVICSRARRRLD